MEEPTPKRVVIRADARLWLAEPGRLARASVVTSLPDWSELQGASFDEWRRFFVDAAALILARVPGEGVAIFAQSDIVADGVWIDKGALVQEAAARAGVPLIFHKIVCRVPAGTVTIGRASYSHLLGFARVVRPSLRRATPDVIDGGAQPGPRALGVEAALAACRFVRDETTTRTIVDPFCGLGTVLAAANALGLDAVGVDTSARAVRQARRLRFPIDNFATTARGEPLDGN
jgi:hypothetical protein